MNIDFCFCCVTAPVLTQLIERDTRRHTHSQTDGGVFKYKDKAVGSL